MFQGFPEIKEALISNKMQAAFIVAPLAIALKSQWYMGGSIQSVTPQLGPTVGIAFTCELEAKLSCPGGIRTACMRLKSGASFLIFQLTRASLPWYTPLAHRKTQNAHDTQQRPFA